MKNEIIISKKYITFKSNWKPVQDGVPKGLLFHLIFLLYVNDLPSNYMT